jgi:hypothetical protein
LGGVVRISGYQDETPAYYLSGNSGALGLEQRRGTTSLVSLLSKPIPKPSEKLLLLLCGKPLLPLAYCGIIKMSIMEQSSRIIPCVHHGKAMCLEIEIGDVIALSVKAAPARDGQDFLVINRNIEVRRDAAHLMREFSG